MQPSQEPASTPSPESNSTKGPGPLAVVGLGASAGGLKPLQAFFAAIAPDSQLAFVVVMHLAPEHESSLPEILQLRTKMPVLQVNDKVRVQANHVYVIPPGKQLTMSDGFVVTSELHQPLGRRVAIDLFFRTLAEQWGHRGISVILSGSDSDGVIGVRHIKAQGGITIAQDPAEAEHASMPRNAIESGMIDWVLPVAEMPRKLLEYVRNEQRLKLPPEEVAEAAPEDEADEVATAEGPPKAPPARQTGSAQDEAALHKVLAFVRSHTGHDFGHYKRATVLRRIARRLQVNSLEDIPSYLGFLQSHPMEAPALLSDLLIGVTNFFRDRAAFDSLANNLPQIFASKQPGDEVRVWVPACATGEEAYSIAMLMRAHMDKLESPPSVQMFATDLDVEAVGDARRGEYPTAIEADVPPEFLRRHFVNHHGRYVISKEIRGMVLFTPHDLLSDSPFSRIDLVSCRNLLIYLKPDAQHRVLDIFHFALRPGGLLFLGSSETVDGEHTLFAAIDKTHRIYVRRSGARVPLVISLPVTLTPKRIEPSTLLPRNLRTPLRLPSVQSRAGDPIPVVEARSTADLHLALVEQYAPPSVIIDEHHNVLHVSARAGRYLQFSAGVPSAELLKAVDESLRVPLRTALFRAAQTGENITAPRVALEANGDSMLLDLHIRPARDSITGNYYFLIVFEEHTTEGAVAAAALAHEPAAPHLEEELRQMRQQLSQTVEQYEASNEELKASNEELQAMNEELRSATEELETSREELQSVNEELTTVNYELKTSVEDLSKANSDLQNLMASTDIGTIFLNRSLHIERFTPPVRDLFNLRENDLGRPLSDLTSHLEYPDLEEDARLVLRDLTKLEREVRSREGQSFLVRLVPYRSLEDRIDGVILNFVEITERRKAEEQRAQSQQQLDLIVGVAPLPILYLDPDGTVRFANRTWLDWIQRTREETFGRSLREILGDEHFATVQPYFARALHGEILSFEFRRNYPALGEREVQVQMAPDRDAAGKVVGVVGALTDISHLREAELALRESEARFRQFAENSSDLLWIAEAETGQLEFLSPAFEEVCGLSSAEVMRNGEHWNALIHPDDRAPVSQALARARDGETVALEYRIVRAADGEARWIRGTAFPMRNEKGVIVRVGGLAQDVTEAHRHAAELRVSEERLSLLVEGARDYAMFLLDPSNIIVHWNSGAERVFGWSAEEALGKSGELIFTPEDRAIEAEEHEIRQAMEHGRALDQRWHLRKDGSRIWVDGVMHRLDDEHTGALRGFAKIARDASGRRKIEQDLERAHAELEERVRERTAELQATNDALNTEISQRQRLEREILGVTERERARISQDLHDSLCQALTATAFLLKSRAKSFAAGDPEAAEALLEAAETVNENAGLARDLARGLHPFDLGSGGLPSALRELCARTQEKINCRCQSPRSIALDENLSVNLYRIAQEAVTNASKHAKASEIVIELRRLSREIILSIKDDGQPMKPKAREGLGIHMMQYRANAIGGTLEFTTPECGGTVVTCRVPRPKKSAARKSPSEKPA